MSCQTRDNFTLPGSRSVNWQAFLSALCLLLFLLASFSAAAQAPPKGVDSQFDVIGFIEEATLDACGTAGLCGGKITINGQAIVIPANTMVLLPANAVTWTELFELAPAPYGPKATGMALSDLPAPLTHFEAHVIGNQVNGTFTAGLIFVSQQAANNGAGFINHIDYATGEIHVGGNLLRDAQGVPTNVLDVSNSGTRVRLNDPAGVFGRKTSPDPRMTLDPDNPTVRSKTGFPMCIPRSDPALAPEDPGCPQANRPKDAVTGKFLTIFDMAVPAIPTPAVPTQPLDPRLMAPFEVGDYVVFAGTLVADSGIKGPFPATVTTYIAAHTMTGNLGIFTQPGVDPAYTAIDVTVFGNGGVLEPGFLEATVRTRFEGFTTDPSRDIQLYAVDFAPDGTVTDRLWGFVGVDQGPPTGAVKGRWRFRPPCTGVTPTARFCFGPVIESTFLPAAREVRAAIAGTWVTPRTVKEKNGLIAGQYHAPIFTYLFPENLPGTTPPPINFELIPFLSKGGYPSSSGKFVTGRLAPFPVSAAAVVCNAPIANAGINFSVASGTSNVPLNGTATGTGPFSYAWTSASGGPAINASPGPLAPNPTFNAPVVTVSTPFTFTLTVSGCSGQTATATVTVTVTPGASASPIVAPVQPLTLLSGAKATLTAKLTAPTTNPISFDWVETSVPIDASFSHVPGAPEMSVTHVLPKNQVTDDVLQFKVTATDSVTKAVSPPVVVGVTYKPIPDIVTVVAATYRRAQQRLNLTVTSSVINPNLVLTLAPYQTSGGTGVPFDPVAFRNTFTSNGAGTYTLILNGVPQPADGASLTVNSNIGGSTVPFAVVVR